MTETLMVPTFRNLVHKDTVLKILSVHILKNQLALFRNKSVEKTFTPCIFLGCSHDVVFRGGVTGRDWVGHVHPAFWGYV